MTETKKVGVPVDSTKGYQPGKLNEGYQPERLVDVPSGVSKPGAGHQPSGAGDNIPPLPTIGSGVKPAPAKKE